jgi:hypothetical protein
MKTFKLISILSIIVMSLIACEDVKEVSKKAKEMAIATKQQATQMVVNVADAAEQKVVTVKNAAEQKVDEATQQVTIAVNNAVAQVVNEIKAWIYQVLTPLFPWMFIISFLLLFVALKAAIPLSTIAVMQIFLSLISYILTFWLFAQLGLTSFAVKGTLYFVLPIAVISIAMNLCRDKIFPKINELNASLTSKVQGDAQAS